MPFCKTVVTLFVVSAVLFATLCSPTAVAQENDKIAALIIDGQNNHRNWPDTSLMMKSYLEHSGRFTVDIARTRAKGTDPDFKPEFANYGVVISNYNGSPWPESTKTAFVEYVKSGGGFVAIHAADNAFGDWQEYNEIIGLGGWGGRSESSGPYVYFLNDKKVVDTNKGRGGSHGAQHEFTVVKRTDHPIVNGLPSEWMHAKDELYDRLRGPASNMQVLATSFSSKKFGGTDRHEPMLITVEYGKGRTFHTPMGHGNYSQECVGFITTFLRGTEWAATGQVTIGIPGDFPTADKSSSRKFDLEMAQLQHRVGQIVAMLESGDDAMAIIEAVAEPEQVEKFRNAADREQTLARFKQTKAPQLLTALKAIDFSTAQKNGNQVTFPIEPRAITFEKIDGRWRIKN